VSLSITEAEYVTCSEGAKDASWTRKFLNGLPLTIRIQSLPILYTDNEAANKLSKNHAYHRRTCHIDYKYHYVRQEARCGNLEIMGISGKNQLLVADPLMKLLPMNSPQGMERKNWPNTTSTKPISVGQHKIDLAITITAEEQKWVNEFVIAADEEATGDMSWMNWMLEQERVLEYSRMQID
jgi:hypothetical protein